jgi:hypothetical protein
VAISNGDGSSFLDHIQLLILGNKIHTSELVSNDAVSLLDHGVVVTLPLACDCH